MSRVLMVRWMGWLTWGLGLRLTIVRRCPFLSGDLGPLSFSVRLWPKRSLRARSEG